MLARIEVKLQKPEKAATGQLGECLEIRVARLRCGHISFVRHGKRILEIVGGDIEAPTLRVTSAEIAAAERQQATPNAEEEADEGPAADEEEERLEAEAEDAALAAEAVEVEQERAARQAEREAAQAAQRARDLAMAEALRTKIIQATRKVFGPGVTVNRERGVRILAANGEELGSGTNWDEAFRAAARASGLWTAALYKLCSDEKARAFVSLARLTTAAAEQLRASPGVQEVNVNVELGGGVVRAVPSLAL